MFFPLVLAYQFFFFFFFSIMVDTIFQITTFVSAAVPKGEVDHVVKSLFQLRRTTSILLDT